MMIQVCEIRMFQRGELLQILFNFNAVNVSV